MDEIKSKRAELKLWTRRAQKLEQQVAISGRFVDPAILIELEDIEQRKADIEKELRQLGVHVHPNTASLTRLIKTPPPPLDEIIERTDDIKLLLEEIDRVRAINANRHRVIVLYGRGGMGKTSLVQ